MNIDYKRYNVIASICVAVLIVSLAVLLTDVNGFIYDILRNEARVLSSTEVKTEERDVIFSEMDEDFDAIFSSKYNPTGYEICQENVEKLNAIKASFRWAVFFGIVAFAGIVYCFMILSRRRDYTPLIYGGYVAFAVYGLLVVKMLISHREKWQGIKAMIFERSYDYFSDADVLRSLIPVDYARAVFIYNFVLVVVLAVASRLVRKLILFLERPHEF